MISKNIKVISIITIIYLNALYKIQFFEFTISLCETINSLGEREMSST